MIPWLKNTGVDPGYDPHEVLCVYFRDGKANLTSARECRWRILNDYSDIVAYVRWSDVPEFLKVKGVE